MRVTFAKVPLLFLVLTSLLCTLFLQLGPLPKGPRPQSSLHPAGPQHPRARRRGVGWHGTATLGNRGRPTPTYRMTRNFRQPLDEPGHSRMASPRRRAPYGGGSHVPESYGLTEMVETAGE